MTVRPSRGTLAALVLAACWLLGRPGTAEAHPALCGPWRTPAPQGGFIVYDFAPGEYVGFGFWRGTFTFSMPHGVVSTGIYELRMWSPALGTLGIRDGTLLSTTVGTVDFGERVLNYQNAAYRR